MLYNNGNRMKHILVSLSKSKVYGAWVFQVNPAEPYHSDNTQCVWLAKDTGPLRYLRIYDSEHVFVEALIVHSMYALIMDQK